MIRSKRSNLTFLNAFERSRGIFAMEKVNITYNVLQNSSPQKPQDNAKHISNCAEHKTIQQC